MKPLTEVEAILIDSGLKASGLDYAALESVREMLSPGKSRGRGKAPEPLPLTNMMAFAGFTIGAHTRSAESLGVSDVDELKAAAKDVRELFDSLPSLDSPVWVYFELGQWGATGDRTYLSHIMDRARHRDGSSAAISASATALGVLQLAAFTNPAYLGIYSEMGFNPEAVGYLPSNSSIRESFEALRGERDMQPETIVLDPDAGKPETRPSVMPAIMLEAPKAPATAFVGGNLALQAVDPDFSTGSVQTPFGLISISDALGIVAALTVATRRLILPLPFDGYQWDDYAGSELVPSSILFTQDSFEGERLKLFQPNPLNALFIAGRVTQEGTNYVPSVFDPASGLFMPIGPRLTDLNLAKFTVADRFRGMLCDAFRLGSSSYR